MIHDLDLEIWVARYFSRRFTSKLQKLSAHHEILFMHEPILKTCTRFMLDADWLRPVSGITHMRLNGSSVGVMQGPERFATKCSDTRQMLALTHVLNETPLLSSICTNRDQSHV